MKNERGGVLIIVIGIVLILILMGFFRSTPTLIGGINYKKILNLPCGLTLSTPDKEATVSFPLRVQGYVNGCGWEEISGRVGSVQVFDGYGIALTDEVLLVTGDSEKPFEFDTTLQLTTPPRTGRGSIVLTGTTGFIYAQPISF